MEEIKNRSDETKLKIMQFEADLNQRKEENQLTTFITLPSATCFLKLMSQRVFIPPSFFN